MFYQEDWLMRQIQSLVQFIARVVFNKAYIVYEIFDERNLSQTDIIFTHILKLLANFNICAAENMLLANYEQSADYLKLSIDFYQRLNDMSDYELESNNFSREEIDDGLKHIMKMSKNTLLTTIL